MNITLSIDKVVLARARKVARRMGKSVEELVRDYLGQLAGSASADEEIDEVLALSRTSGGRSRGARFDREQAHDRFAH